MAEETYRLNVVHPNGPQVFPNEFTAEVDGDNNWTVDHSDPVVAQALAEMLQDIAAVRADNPAGNYLPDERATYAVAIQDAFPGSKIIGAPDAGPVVPGTVY